MARLFVAVWPTDEVVEALAAIHRKNQRGVRFVPPENWHVTLRFLGEASPEAVAAALDGGTFGATTARLGPAVDVMSERALVVPVAGVDDLAAVVTEQTRRLGEPPRKRFVGHVTIARVKAHVPMPRCLGDLVSAEFPVAEIALVESRLRPEGPRYETLCTWPTTSGTSTAPSEPGAPPVAPAPPRDGPGGDERFSSA
ncbi:RNA 2',3'-cyclic phosphodiesterase [Desertimonas flava]|uniref:RNA 2',3'-cyclic phosphodiesterase n=1 Tax=Desertimonas flava TaxID=2064846 RepID=UPI000E347B9D|nr:RNA 2',3'-cyclic phosphodiesterase [Desertimonas flava]